MPAESESHDASSGLGAKSESGKTGARVQLEGVTLQAGDRLLLKGASAEFLPGQVTLIVGPSGVGKTLLLRAIAGLIDGSTPGITTEGAIRVGESLAGSGTPSTVGVVFQNFALFDELSSQDNVRFAAAHRNSRTGRAGGDEDQLTPLQLLDELGVPGDVRTASLSGGQRQRLAIARTLAYGAEVILYDEPTSGLDQVTAERVADLIRRTHDRHPRTSIIVTHDYQALSRIADRVYLLDPAAKSLVEIPQTQWDKLHDLLASGAGLARHDTVEKPPNLARRGLARLGDLLIGTTRAAEQVAFLPLSLLPRWKSMHWGCRYLWHYLRLVADPSAWLYVALAGGIIGFVATYFTFRFLPYRGYTEPLIIENLLEGVGFSLYRILVPILIALLVAARCGAAVASDLGGKVYGQQIDALRTFGIRPERYLLTGVMYAFLLGTPLLTMIGFFVARLVSLVVFLEMHPGRGPYFWDAHFHRQLELPGQLFYAGSAWMLAKVLCCAAGAGCIAYVLGMRPKHSSTDISRGITRTILWSTLHVLIVHLVFALLEF